MDNKSETAATFPRTNFGRGESPAKVTMPMDHRKQLSPRPPLLGRKERPTRDVVLTMPAGSIAKRIPDESRIPTSVKEKPCRVHPKVSQRPWSRQAAADTNWGNIP